jgi:hypothetical protein
MGENTEKYRKLMTVKPSKQDNKEQSMSETEKFLGYIKKAKAKNTHKSY